MCIRKWYNGGVNKQLLRDYLGWGAGLWLIGYVLGIVLFAFVSVAAIGWIILPIGTVITLWVLIKKIERTDLKYYLTLAAAWTLIAVVFDYLFLVKTFNPEDGYYKLDVYIYYALIFILPVVVGWYKGNEDTTVSV